MLTGSYKVHAEHDVFSRYGAELQRCIPCLLHGDEGVGLRRKPVLQILWGSLLRVGCGAIERFFLYTTCPHKYYSKYNAGSASGNIVIDRLLEEFARSASRAYYQGIETPHGQVYLVFLGLAGDHPWQVKAVHSLRSHLAVEVCPHCHANVWESVPFEDISRTAMWRKTVFQSVPWPRGTRNPFGVLPHGDHPDFLKWDLMHMIPHGCGRNFCASVTCMLAGPLSFFSPSDEEGTKKERCLSAAHAQFESWLACMHKTVRDLKDFTPELLQWKLNRDFPDCNCKASDTTLWIKWLLDLLGTMPWKWSEPLQKAYEGLEALDSFIRLCYSGDRLFFDARRQQEGADYVERFLQAYTHLASYWWSRNWCLFGFVPKCHFTAHWHEELSEARRLGQCWAWNPGAFSTPMAEDMVGQCSRISRGVHPGAVPVNTIRKYLVHARQQWDKS